LKKEEEDNFGKKKAKKMKIKEKTNMWGKLKLDFQVTQY